MGLSSNCSPERWQIYQFVFPGEVHENVLFLVPMSALCDFFKILFLLIGHVKIDITLFLFILPLVGRKQFPMFNDYFFFFG